MAVCQSMHALRTVMFVQRVYSNNVQDSNRSYRGCVCGRRCDPHGRDRSVDLEIPLPRACRQVLQGEARLGD